MNPDHDDIPEQTDTYDLVAERGILGAMMLSRDRIADAVEIVKPAHYYRPAHELIHRAITDLDTRGDAADPITVGAELKKRGELDRAGGPGYLHRLISPATVAANVVDYAEIVAEKYLGREVAKVLIRATGQLRSGEGDVAAVMAFVQGELLAAEEQQPQDDTRLLGDGLGLTLDKVEHLASNRGTVTGVPTGLADLDSLTQGLQPGQVIVVAARPAIGKSTLALDFVRNAAIKHEMPAALFSLEMGRDEINMRLLSAEARVGLHHMRSGHMTDEDWTRLAKRMPEIQHAPLWIDDSPNLGMAQIRAKARRLRDRHGLRLLVIDYLQLMQGGGKRSENRQLEVSEISRGIKLLAKELEIPIVALSQLNRGPEQRADKTPAMADLRESGSIENDADVVILLHRVDAYEKDSPRAGEADLIVAKHRNGPTAVITCAFQGHYSRFVDMAQS